MLPVQLGALGNQWVARGGINGVVKRCVGSHHGLDILAAGGQATLVNQLGVHHRVGLGGETGRQGIERASYLVNLTEPNAIERRHQQAASRSVQHKAVFFQQPQRQQHGLA